MTHHLGYPPQASEGRNTGNSRNGKTAKTVIGETGEMEITVPRDRNAEFEPQLVKNRQRRLLGLWIGETEGAKFWLSVMTGFKNRGVQDILIACVDGLKGFPDAIEAVYPKSQVQLCIIDMVRHSLRYVGWKERKAVAADLRAIHTAPTVEAAEQALEAFERKWTPRFPAIAKSWRANWTNLIPFYSYPPEIRKAVYTTNAIESMQASLRKMTRQRGAFPNAESVRKVIYLALQRISKNWQRRVLDWVAVLNHFTTVFKGRIPG
jgi:putative transposase